MTFHHSKHIQTPINVIPLDRYLRMSILTNNVKVAMIIADHMNEISLRTVMKDVILDYIPNIMLLNSVLNDKNIKNYVIELCVHPKSITTKNKLETSHWELINTNMTFKTLLSICKYHLDKGSINDFLSEITTKYKLEIDIKKLYRRLNKDERFLIILCHYCTIKDNLNYIIPKIELKKYNKTFLNKVLNTVNPEDFDCSQCDPLLHDDELCIIETPISHSQQQKYNESTPSSSIINNNIHISSSNYNPYIDIIKYNLLRDTFYKPSQTPSHNIYTPSDNTPIRRLRIEDIKKLPRKRVINVILMRYILGYNIITIRDMFIHKNILYILNDTITFTTSITSIKSIFSSFLRDPYIPKLLLAWKSMIIKSEDIPPSIKIYLYNRMLSFKSWRDSYK